MDTKYELYIYGGGTGVTISSKKGDHGNYIIKKLSYSKGLYSPNSVEIDISVSGVSQTDIRTTFESKSADLKVYAKENSVNITHQICQDYIVYQLRIVSEASTKTVHLNLFSRDKLLTLDKFSRVYLNQRLGLNIIEDSLKDGGFLAGCKVGVLKDGGNLDIKRLQFLYYQTEGKPSKPVEAIQPYRVQYNEDFYQFISRVACQCGEMLFFEDGKLTLGPDPASDTLKSIGDNDIYRIEYPAVENSLFNVKDYHWDFFTGKCDSPLQEAAGLQYSDCAAFDEYYDIYDKETLPDSTDNEFYWPDVANLVLKTAAPAVGIAAASHDAVTASAKIAKALTDSAAIIGRYAANSNYVNKQYKENVFDNPKAKTNNFSEDQQKDDKKLCQFADVFPAGQLKHDRLAEIREMEMTAVKQTITVQIKTSSFTGLKLKLGNRVRLEGNAVAPVSAKIHSEGDTTPTYVITACRGDFLKSGSDEMDITEIEIVPFQNGIFVPPYNKCAEFTPVQPQIAIVSDDTDPRQLGRVRVRYPWQIGNLGSPWVRVLTPFSTANGDCIHFQPKEGDEVMLGYVGGNIERPYVIGSLFGNDASKIHDNLYLTNNNTIKVGSQRLDFREGSMNAFIASFFPAWGFATQFAPGFASNLKTDHSSGWHGLTRLTDVNSFWTIEGNTATRAITIDSAWGKVSISAYTGIDIEAVGDVTIKGNNINIKAQNNVTIESGIALKNARKSKDAWKEEGSVLKAAGADFLSDYVNLDLSFLRTIWESIVPPKEGTLKIKSNRYLMLEAGKDGLALDNEISPTTQHRQFAIADTNQVKRAVEDLNMLYNNVDENATIIAEKHNAVVDATNALDAVITILNKDSKFKDSKLKVASEVKAELKDKSSYKELSDYTEKIKEQLDNLEQNDLQNDELLVPEADVNLEKNLVRWTSGVTQLKTALSDFAYYSNLDNYFYKGDKDIVEKLSDIITKKVGTYNFSATDKNDVYQFACEKYFTDDNPNFTLGNGNWTQKVDGLSCNEELLKQQDPGFFSTLFSNAIDSIKSGSDYDVKAYTDTQAKNLPEGKIIMSSNKNHSLVVTDGNGGPDATGSLKQTPNSSLDVVKAAMRRVFNDKNPQNVNMIG